MNDFSTPRRMSPGAFVIIFVKSFREMAGASIVAFLYLMFRSDDSDSSVSVLMKIALAIGIFIAFSLLTAFLRFYFRKFHIEGDKLVYSRGIAQKGQQAYRFRASTICAQKEGWSTGFLT